MATCLAGCNGRRGTEPGSGGTGGAALDAAVHGPAGGALDGGTEDGSVPWPDAAIDGGWLDTPPVSPLYLRFVPLALDPVPSQLTALAFVPGRNEFLALTRTGLAHHYRLEGEAATLLGSFRPPNVHTNLDCGLISLAFDPDFERNGFLYLGQCFSQYESGIQRLRFDPHDYDAIADSAVEILRHGDAEATRPWHNVGAIGFEPDGTLWAIFGDKTRPLHGQDPATPLGALLRIRPSRVPDTGGCTPAADNPHATDPRFHPEVYAYGFRSPWTGTRIDRGRWLIGDVGGGRVEEINLVSAPGQNFGWNLAEGPCGASCEPDVVDPLVHWGRSNAHLFVREDPYAIHRSNRVVWVGPVYRPPSPALDRYAGQLTDRVLFGDMCAGYVRILELDAAGNVALDAPAGHLEGASGWAMGTDGYVYAASFGRCTTGASAVYPASGIFRAVRSEQPSGFMPPDGGFPDKLSALGLFPNAPDLSVFPTRAEHYTPRWELWSNGLGKLRHRILPAGTEITRAADSYLFPDGTLFFKTFTADGRPIETRVMHLSAGVWYYAAYRWNPQGTDAERLDLETALPVRVTLDNEEFDHEIPSYQECRGCHEAGARRVLGYTPLQLGDGIDLDGPLPAQDAGVLEDGGDATLDPRTRDVLGYVYANCSHCHDGSGGSQASFSLLPEEFFAQTVGRPTEGSASGTGIRIVPGDPDSSVLHVALTGGDDGLGIAAMPPLGVQRQDTETARMLRGWIQALGHAGGDPDAGERDAAGAGR